MSQYDVFLAHNKADQAAVEVLARRLKQESQLNPSVDEWNLRPGESWRVNLQRTLDKSRTCALFLGPKGEGSWENHIQLSYESGLLGLLKKAIATGQQRPISVFHRGSSMI